MYKKRYNVEASRARDQMWVVYSLNPSIDLKPEDLRLAPLNHALNPDSLTKRFEEASQRAESEFERQVAKLLVWKDPNHPDDWSPEGKWILGRRAGSTVFGLPADGSAKQTILLDTAHQKD